MHLADIQRDLQCVQGIFAQYVCSLDIEPMTLWAVNENAVLFELEKHLLELIHLKSNYSNSTDSKLFDSVC